MTGQKDLEASFYINSFDVDINNKILFPTLCRYMQETAYYHAEELELGHSDLLKKKLIWVLSRFKVVVERYPLWNQKLKVRTWPVGVHRLFALRDFQVTDEQNSLVAQAASSWLVLEEEKRRPVKIEKIFNTEKIGLLESQFTEPPGKITVPEEREEGLKRKVRYSDLDRYNHVNNTKYMEWIIDNYDLSFLEDHEISYFEINFIGEALYNDKVRIESASSHDSNVDIVVREGDGKILTTASLRWRKV